MTSLLGPVAWQFSKVGGQIFDNQKEQVLELYPAGFAQSFLRPSPVIENVVEKVNRQEFYKQLYEEAEEIGTVDNQFPFKDYEYVTKLTPESANRYDPFAIKIELSVPGDSYWNDYHIGYVPAKINQHLLANIERVSDIRILSVTDSWNDKFYHACFAIGYDGVIFEQDDGLKRFRSIR